MRCPVCGNPFDMRDLSAVMAHEHGMEVKAPVSFSHSTLRDSPGEVYIKGAGKMVTLYLKRGVPYHSGSDDPPRRT